MNLKRSWKELLKNDATKGEVLTNADWNIKRPEIAKEMLPLLSLGWK